MKVIVFPLLIVATLASARDLSNANFLFPDQAHVAVQKRRASQKLTCLFEKMADTSRMYLHPNDSTVEIYLADVVLDTALELVYEGLYGTGEGRITALFQAQPDSMTYIAGFFGLPVSLNRASGDTITVFKTGCCGSDVDWFFRKRFLNGRFEDIDSIRIHWSVQLPKGNPVHEQFELLNPGYALRATPMINNNPDTLWEKPLRIARGNVIIELAAGSKMRATAKATDCTGRDWLFVVVNKKQVVGYDLVEGWGGKCKPKECGWLSTKFLKRR